MPSLLLAMLYGAGSDARVPLRIGGTDTTGREGAALLRQEPPSNEQRRKLRTRKPDKTSRKETQDFKERQLQTTAGEIASFKAWGLKHGKGCSGYPSAALPGGGEHREQSLYDLSITH